jgi:3-isopropylmalate/(R)-2-methylmalate dehydratase small subunit
MKSKIKAAVHLLGNSISTDMIIPSRYINAGEKIKLAEYAFSESNKNLAGKIKNGDALIAGANFGICHYACPHQSLELSISCLKELGIACVIANSYSRLFYRTAINDGLWLLESKDAYRLIDSKEEIEIDIHKGEISCQDGPVAVSSLPESIWRILEAGGLIPYAKKAIGKH